MSVRRLGSVGLVGALLMMSASARAQQQDQPSQPAQEQPAPSGSQGGGTRIEVNTGGGGGASSGAEPDGFRLDLAAGVKGGLTGAWMLEVPANRTVGAQTGESKSYYAGFGTGGDIGLSLDVRALGIVGLESGVRLSFDNAEGYNDINEANTGERLVRVYQRQSTTSFRVPLLLKLSSPSGVVRPVLGLGIEFVNQTDSSISYEVEEVNGREAESQTRARERRNQIEPSNYRLLTAAFGIEIDVGPVKIPIELRAQYNINYAGESFEERVRVEGQGADAIYYYDGAYQGHFGVTIGLLYDKPFYL